MTVPATVTEAPPPFQDHVIELVSSEASKITGVSVYTSRAEITRLFKLDLKTGQNQIIIDGLPNGIDKDSVRVDGHGSATIHDVTISPTPPKPAAVLTSPTLEELRTKQTSIENAKERAKNASDFLVTYLSKQDPPQIDPRKLQDIIDNYETASHKLDEKLTKLRADQRVVSEELRKEEEILRLNYAATAPSGMLYRRATVAVFADAEGPVELELRYAVTNATWTPIYDVRIDTEAGLKDKPVVLTYKASIAQHTGEDWRGVPIVLETSKPTVGVNLPSIHPWKLSVYAPPPPPRYPAQPMMGMPMMGQPPVIIQSRSRSSSRSRSRSRERRRRSRSRSRSPRRIVIQQPSIIALPAQSMPPPPVLQQMMAEASRASDFNVTFTVPGLMSIPSDRIAHSVTIVKLELGTTLEWVSIPKVDAKVYLKAVIKNASDYSFLSGTSSIYLDGSFIAKSRIPSVSPGQSFDCSLGLDPSIRVTYPPLSKNLVQTGFVTKSKTQTYTQQIAIHSTKSVAVDNLIIRDQVPVSEDSTIIVKLSLPSLEAPDVRNASNTKTMFSMQKETVVNKSGVRVPAPVNVGNGVVAQWDGVDNVLSEDDVGSLGKDGLLFWKCSVPPQGKVNLSLRYEVSAPVDSRITGLSN
ncbi:hypothetical protein FA15DRAFT_619475 [Coprinopsis marcescibilis]|uniref:Mucoidy inhibitor A n=1 Tax=Coprinopsis marcescibilis TaxID=230819 RepID=A0A5C3KX76_COPMA|nr:hypothetical protein FA15DRAFT_619475 [Coprinopsis marcescibilis]